MTVADLIALLQKHDPAKLVAMRNAEGNIDTCSGIRETDDVPPWWPTDDALEILAD